MMANVSVIYHHFPHYRAPVLRALARSKRHNYTFFGAPKDHKGIKAFTGDDIAQITTIRFHTLGPFENFAGHHAAVRAPYDATLIIGNMRMPSAWRALSRAKGNGLKTAYWAHGWLRPEPPLKRKLRVHFFNRADRILTYGTRAKTLGMTAGVCANKIKPIWNSLDWEQHTRLYERYKNDHSLRASVGMPEDRPVLITLSRLTPACRYDWLIEAAAGLDLEIWMIGDGPERDTLKSLARARDVPLKLCGALYDEDTVARHIMAADLLVSPGKVGLTAMHALGLGTPVVTHGDLDRQMPEVEALTDGKTGYLFDYGSIPHLRQMLLNALENRNAAQGDLCRAALKDRYTPNAQACLIDDAIDEMMS